MKRWPDTKPIHDTPLAKAASHGGGVLIYARLSTPLGENGELWRTNSRSRHKRRRDAVRFHAHPFREHHTVLLRSMPIYYGENMNSQNIKVGDVVAIRGDLRRRSDGTCQYTPDQLVLEKYVRHAHHKGIWTGVVTKVNNTTEEALVEGGWRSLEYYEVIYRNPQGEHKCTTK